MADAPGGEKTWEKSEKKTTASERQRPMISCAQNKKPPSKVDQCQVNEPAVTLRRREWCREEAPQPGLGREFSSGEILGKGRESHSSESTGGDARPSVSDSAFRRQSAYEEDLPPMASTHRFRRHTRFKAPSKAAWGKCLMNSRLSLDPVIHPSGIN
ncbi:hypothetical protein CVT26_007216 [Gymnopilus dilepis]|uniref:Uncharacterized protein n=1 Tax=Gymnopilus dilepis TaxID=231916 RepID=A0A409W6N5_9AGAR|nr:hypothetical protein CVT26_007216 [Gymnopilus dilepis]